MEASRRAAVRGPTFIRLLARLADADAAPDAQPLSDRLSQWIEWTQTLALSAALDGAPAVAGFGAAGTVQAEAQECARVRRMLAAAIDGDRAFAPPRAGAAIAGARSAAAVEDAGDYPFFRQRYLVLQQTLEAGAGRLRERLRERLTVASPELARLAALDAVMERALGRRERSLLGAAPALLGRRFERLRERAQDAADGGEPDRETWLPRFRADMREALHAELDLRLQPAQGLLDALRARAND
ncbi:DUF3348 family protein [Lysobacter yananisis]|uniref:DUF3348 family protein n=1 Tax=Lysobacter yananisis TaxID=1003114 RepID=A0ABY9PD60_9GAMM|nr:DUF3348 family protein [Lysobacter yananisis]WMT03985.1 DUF3348 family protein [Lysobacter yananisis]